MLDWITPDNGARLEGGGVRLRAPRMSDYPAWRALRQASRQFLQPWEPTWPDDDLERPAFRRRLSIYARDQDLGLGYPFFVLDTGDNLVGGVNLRDVRRGVSLSAAVGYWVGAPYVRRGYTLAAVAVATQFAFRRLGLHRIEAACVPENTASQRLLERAGFKPEGQARSYLKINGAWRDHLLYGLLREDNPGTSS